MEDLVSPNVDFISSLWPCCARHRRYLCKLQKNKYLLRNAMKELKEVRDDVERRVVEAEADPNEPKKHTDSVSGWLQRVEIIESDVEKILQKVDEQQLGRERCFGGCCPPTKWWSNYKLGKSVVMKMASVGELKRNIHFEEVTYRLPPPPVQDMNMESIVDMESMFDKVWRLINSTDDQVRIMGLYGQGGVGKTTILKQINDEFLKSEHGFDYVVIFEVVSKQINYEAIQKKIGERLSLSDSLQGDGDGDENSRAEKISNVLRKNNYVLLLDDIWERVDLQRIGIPIHPQGNSKLIFTTRSERVCGLMEATHTFQVECLPWDKAWRLFQDKVGEDALTSFPGACELAKDVVKECGGLPLSLITIGRAMSTKKSVQEWRDAIITLRRYALEFEGMRDEVLPRLKLSYDYLHSETEKSCFRYCSLYPEDHSIEIAKLVDYWIAEGFLDGFDNNLDEARNGGHTIIGSLKSACLLESSGEDDVKMHDVIRDLALWIVNDSSSRSTEHSGSNSDKFLVALNDPCEKWENAERIFWDATGATSSNNHLPTSPNLLTLIVQNMDIVGYCGLPTFFQHMPLLRVLDLSNAHCFDGEFPISICELHELQYLNLSGTFFKELPVEFRKLVKLKFLVSPRLSRIPAGLIANLSQLQVLDLGCAYDGRLGEDGPSFSELDGLKQLQEVRITIRTYIAFKKFLCNRKLQMVCTSLMFISSDSSSKRVLDLSNFKSLKYLMCSLSGFSELEELVLYGSTTDGGLLSNLKTLSLFCLPKLSRILWIAVAQPDLICSHFKSLHHISIVGCDAFKDLTWLVYVENLKTLVVWDCKGLETIIELGDDGLEGASEGDQLLNTRGGGGGVFRRLKTLVMYRLPKLKSICRHPLAFPSIETISISRCPELKKLPLDSRSNINKSKFHHFTKQGTNLMLSRRIEEVSVKPENVEIIAAEVNENLQTNDDHYEPSKRTEQVVVRPQSIEIIADEVDKNLHKDDDQHEPRKCTEEVAVRPRRINIIAANMDENLQEIATRPPTVEIIVAQKKMRKIATKQKSLGMSGYMFEKAWSLLGEEDDDEIRIMGLYGQGGVGKTTLLKQINNEFIKSRYQRGLDVVILVLVSKSINVEAVQRKIGERLKLPLQGDESRRAEEIFNVLRNKNFILLLDDIWERIDLQCIGVPRPQGKSKIIFTTRSEIVCRLMEADKTFKVECLPWNKAWSLFQENVGEEALNSDPRAPELAKIIARECAGLPLALVTIGRAMSSKKSMQEWNDTITTLREFGSGSDICDEDFSRLKLSYDNLHTETIKSCFLYCSLYPEHHSIPKSQLIDFWIGEGIFQWVDDIDEVRNRAYDIIENLKGAFLLESGEDEETSVKMHDVIRDLALWIVNEFGKRKDKILVERATGTPNTSDKWENAERIYLTVDINTKEEEEEEDLFLPQNFFPNLLTLMLHGNSYYSDLFLPQNFFQFMPLLRVLDFSELEMEEFPTNITELVELQYLGLAKTNIKALPDELRKLVKLKYLDLSHTYFLQNIPPGVIASLSELRVFNQYHSDFGDWEEDGLSLRELTSLRHLDDLGITVETVLALQRLLRNRKLRMCTRHLTIDECMNLKSLGLLSSSTATTLSLGNLKRLKELACQNCSALAELTMNWAVVEDGQKGLLSNLETLTLWNLPKLNVVWKKQYVCSSFENLKEISIIGCNALKDLTWLLYVRNLETLYLRKCQEVEEILDVGREGDEMLTRDVVFKELKNIYMGNLARLERICKHALAFPSLKSMVVKDCPHLKKLPLDCDSNVNNTLQRIEGGATWWNQLYWEDDQVKSKFLPYFEE